MNPKQTIFACFAHPDDELGCIGTLAQHAKRGDKIVLAFTTSGEMASFFENMSFDEVKKIREEQAKTVAEILGGDVKTMFLGFGDTEVIANRENALKMAKVIAAIKPDAIIAWGRSNRHPDHRGTTQLLFDAATYARIPRLTIPAPPHRLPFHLPMFLYHEETSPLRSVFIDVTDTYEQVLDAYKLYAEFYGWPESGDWVYVRRRQNGMATGVKYAEKFNVMSRYSPVEKHLPLNNR